MWFPIWRVIKILPSRLRLIECIKYNTLISGIYKIRQKCLFIMEMQWKRHNLSLWWKKSFGVYGRPCYFRWISYGNLLSSHKRRVWKFLLQWTFLFLINERRPGCFFFFVSCVFTLSYQIIFCHCLSMWNMQRFSFLL